MRLITEVTLMGLLASAIHRKQKAVELVKLQVAINSLKDTHTHNNVQMNTDYNIQIFFWF